LLLLFGQDGGQGRGGALDGRVVDKVLQGVRQNRIGGGGGDCGWIFVLLLLLECWHHLLPKEEDVTPQMQSEALDQRHVGELPQTALYQVVIALQ